jgi:hypothetical protein
MSVKADVVPLQETASFAGQRLSDDVMITSVVEPSVCEASFSQFFVSELFRVGVRVTPS